MCIIAIKPKGQQMFPKSTIQTMFTNNPDGAGYMYYDYNKKKVVIKKGFMTCNALLKILNERDFTNTNLILHFRIGTSGKMDMLNCHPYPIYDENKTECTTDIAIAHNGVLHAYTPSKDSAINDTQVFIKKVLKPLKKGFQNNNEIKGLIKELIGTNKFAILDDKNKLTLIGDFVRDGEYIFSNSTYRVYTHYYKVPSVRTHKSVSTKNDDSYDDYYYTHNCASKYDSFWDDDYNDDYEEKCYREYQDWLKLNTCKC